MKTLFLCLLVVCCLLFLASCALFRQPKFGSPPQGDRLDIIQASPNYSDGEFRNQIPTPQFSGDAGLISIFWDSIFDKNERLIPDTPLAAVKTDLNSLDPDEDTVIWLGHSSWFIQLDGKRILIDPVFSDYAAPFSFLNKAFSGTSIYTAADMPMIDLLIISHDHWDHLDYPTAITLEPKVKIVICPLGVGTYFEHWGYAREKISEGDWYDRIELEERFTIHVLPARHYSGRLLAKNKTLWGSFALESRSRKIFYSGDSGYGPHFSEIGKAFDGFDLVLLDCGQYDPRWAYIHMTPKEASKAAVDLGARFLMPSHVGRFTIANHPWDEPFVRLTEVGKNTSYGLITPEIGKPVSLEVSPSQHSSWWEVAKN